MTDKMFIFDRITKMVHQVTKTTHIDAIINYSVNACNMFRFRKTEKDIMMLLALLPRHIERQVLHKIRC